jgi:hypothetical protein
LKAASSVDLLAGYLAENLVASKAWTTVVDSVEMMAVSMAEWLVVQMAENLVADWVVMWVVWKVALSADLLVER